MSDAKNNTDIKFEKPTKPAVKEVFLVDEKGNESGPVTQAWYDRNEESFKTAGLKLKK